MNKMDTNQTNFKPIGTLIHGIGASEHLDSSGERISIAGLDTSSLEKDGVFNHEHKNDVPAQIVGKVLKAKKIFSEKDCDTPEELYFWKKSQAPFLYVMGELFDGVGHTGAKEVAAMLKYDFLARKQSRSGLNVINFSVEGAKLDKSGQEIVKSLARKITITTAACNKVAVAELYIPENFKKESLLDFKKSENKNEVFEIIEKNENNVNSGSSKTPKLPWWASSQSEVDKFKQQKQNIAVQDRQKRAGLTSAKLTTSTAPTPKMGPTTLSGSNKIFNPKLSGTMKPPGIKKTLTAGSGLSAPSAKTGGEALASSEMQEDLKKLPSFGQFLKFIQHKYPDMGKDESEAMAKYMTARAMIKAEEALEKMLEMDKSKNVREQRKRIFGTDANAPRISPKRSKMMNQIKDFAQRRFGLPLEIAQGKREKSGKIREDKDNQPAYDVFTPEGVEREKKLLEEYKQKKIKRTDPKPDWRSGSLETQPSPDAAVHELAHAYLAPEGLGIAAFQEYMDEAWGQSQSKYGHMQQKKTSGEIQPMSVENPIRREMGLPANRTTKPVSENQRALDYEGNRFVEGKDKKGKTAFYDRQSRLMTPQTKERVQQVREGSLKFHPEKGWVKDTGPDTLINLRGRGQQQEAQSRLRQRFSPSVAPKKMAASELGKAREESGMSPENKKKFRAERKRFDRDPLAAELTTQPGVSNRGIEARRGDTRTKGVISHGYARTDEPQFHRGLARKYFKQTRDAMLRQPKPNLPKSEEMMKGKIGPECKSKLRAYSRRKGWQYPSAVANLQAKRICGSKSK